MLNKYRLFWLFLVFGFPLYAPIFTASYTYFFDPLRSQKNVDVQFVLQESKGKKGATDEFLMFLSLNDYPFAYIDIYTLDGKSQRFYRQQIGKRMKVDVYYKINRFSTFQMTNDFIPIYLLSEDGVLISKKQSKSILMSSFYSNIIFMVFLLLPLVFLINSFFSPKGIKS